MMDISELLDGLNDKQREAVAAPLGNHLVLAGCRLGQNACIDAPYCLVNCGRKYF